MTEIRRVQAYDGEGECVLDIAVLGTADADALVAFLETLSADFDWYHDPMPALARAMHGAPPTDT